MSKKNKRPMEQHTMEVQANKEDFTAWLVQQLEAEKPTLERQMGQKLKVVRIDNPDGTIEVGLVVDDTVA